MKIYGGPSKVVKTGLRMTIRKKEGFASAWREGKSGLQRREYGIQRTYGIFSHSQEALQGLREVATIMRF